eukprot:scaffold99186_cov47-Attheya_sp.AAC.1
MEIADVEISDEVVRLYLNNNHHSGSAICMEMIRNGYRFNLEGWALSQESPWLSLGTDQQLALPSIRIFLPKNRQTFA